MNVFDIDSMHLIRTVRDMRDEGKDMSGYELMCPPRMFIGAAANPFADPFEYRVIRLAKKIDAGVDFIQTQCIYNLDRFKEWMKMARDEGLTEKVYIMAGVTPLEISRHGKIHEHQGGRYGCSRAGAQTDCRCSQGQGRQRRHCHVR